MIRRFLQWRLVVSHLFIWGLQKAHCDLRIAVQGRQLTILFALARSIHMNRVSSNDYLFHLADLSMISPGKSRDRAALLRQGAVQ
jgi:hypothetical protein